MFKEFCAMALPGRFRVLSSPMQTDIGSDRDWPRFSRGDIETREMLLNQHLQLPESREAIAVAQRIVGRSIDLPVPKLPIGAHSTARAYDSDQRPYLEFFRQLDCDPYQPTWEQWKIYWSALAAQPLSDGMLRRQSTLERNVAGVSKMFWERGLPSPGRSVAHKHLMRELARLDDRKTKKARPLLGDNARRLLASYDCCTLRGLRNCALGTLGLNRGWRGASMVGIQIDHLTFVDLGVSIGLRNEKTSKTGALDYVAIHHNNDHFACVPCIFFHYTTQLAMEGPSTGPLFRNIDRWGYISDDTLCTKSVTDLLREDLRRAGVDDPNSYSSHSYRHGVVKFAVMQKWPFRDIMLITRHRSERGLRAYIEDIDPWYFAPTRSLFEKVATTKDETRGWHHAI